MKKFLHNPRVRFIIISISAILLLFSLYYFFGLDDYIDGLSPFLQFIFVDGLFYFFLYFFFRYAVAIKKSSQWSFGVYLISLAWDLVTPDYHVSKNGALIKGGIIGAGSIDYLIGYIGQSLGIQGNFTTPFFNTQIAWLSIFTYPVAFSIIIIGAVFFVKNLKKTAT